MPRTPGATETCAMFQVRIHGRGGQGVVTSAEMLSLAAFKEGRHAQAFPSFGSERTGAPVVSFCRIADEAIRTREPVAAPDALLVQDPTLLHQVDLFSGVTADAYVLINTSREIGRLGVGDLAGRLRPGRLITVPASELARQYLRRPLPGAAMLGAFAACTGAVSIDSVEDAVRDRFPPRMADGNCAAARAAYELVQSSEPVHA